MNIDKLQLEEEDKDIDSIFIEWQQNIYRLEWKRQLRKSQVFRETNKEYYTSKDGLLSEIKEESPVEKEALFPSAEESVGYLRKDTLES